VTGDTEREETFTYYAVISLPDYPAEKPLGLFRAPNGNVTELEVLRRDGRWHYSPEQMVRMIKGDSDAEIISPETAAKAFKYIKELWR
jgi:hypothetical protein